MKRSAFSLYEKIEPGIAGWGGNIKKYPKSIYKDSEIWRFTGAN